jgi:hypothetical protein
MGTGGNKNGKLVKIYQRVADQINRGFNCIDFEFGTPGKNPNLLRNTQVSGVYLLHYDNDNDVEIEIRVKPKKQKL